MINIIISVKGLQKISYRLYKGYARVTKFIITSDRYNRYQISGETHVNYPSLLNLVQSVIIINANMLINIASRQLAVLYSYFSATGQ